MLPQFQEIKNTSVAFTINKVLQGCVGKADVFKSSDMVVTSICCDSEYDMVLNPNFDVLSAINHGNWYLLGDNRILLSQEILDK